VHNPVTSSNAFQNDYIAALLTLATLIVCCSIASWILVRSCSRIELNSSIQQIPPSDKTKAPASNCHSPFSCNQEGVTELSTATVQFQCAKVFNGLSGVRWATNEIHTFETLNFFASVNHYRSSQLESSSHGVELVSLSSVTTSKAKFHTLFSIY
jgi:hypothetical protein